MALVWGGAACYNDHRVDAHRGLPRYIASARISCTPFKQPAPLKRFVNLATERSVFLEDDMRRPKRTADQLTALIKERSTRFGPWPAKMTMLLYSMNDTWEILVRQPGKTVREEEFRISILRIATQMAVEFDLKQ